MEESAELAMACSKAIRFGADDICPATRQDAGKTAKQRITEEYIDVTALYLMLQNCCIIHMSQDEVSEAIEAKSERVEDTIKLALERGIVK